MDSLHTWIPCWLKILRAGPVLRAWGAVMNKTVKDTAFLELLRYWGER